MLDADGAVRCFACRPPAQVAARAPAAEALVSAGERSKAAPLSLPRPIAIPNAASAYTPGYGAAALPPPPFPLTTSPQGVRRLQPKPPGSVFVGLPAVSQQLAQSLQLQAQREKRVEPKPRLARRPQQKLVLLAYVLTVAAELFALGRRAVIFARRVEVHAWLARALAASTRALHTGMSLAQQRARALGTLIEQHAKPRARVLLTRAARLVLRSKSKRAVPRASVPSRTARVDPSRPIHL